MPCPIPTTPCSRSAAAAPSPAAASCRRKFNLANGAKVAVGADVHYTGKQYYYVDPQTDARGLLNQSGYTLSNARATYTLPGGNHVFTLYANNLGDKVYKNHTLTSFSPGTTNGDSVYWAPRRTVGGSYTYHF